MEHQNSLDSSWHLNSMTGLGQARLNHPQFIIEILVKSLNSKGLDLKLRLCRELNFLETELHQYFSREISRGRVDVQINLEPFIAKSAMSFDNEKAAVSLAALRSFGQSYPELNQEISLSDFLKVSHLWREQEGVLDQEEVKKVLFEGLAVALEDFKASRRHEGALLAITLEKSVLECQSIVEEINARSADDVKMRFQTISSRVKELFANFEIDNERMYQECALLAERSDVKEEIDRMAAHLQHFQKICNHDGVKGRKLDFLCQEMLRESTTLLTKASATMVMTMAINLKAEIERIREQIQNIE